MEKPGGRIFPIGLALPKKGDAVLDANEHARSIVGGGYCQDLGQMFRGFQGRIEIASIGLRNRQGVEDHGMIR